MDQFFDFVAQQLNSELNYQRNNTEEGQDISLRFEDQPSLSREQSWSHFTHLCSNGKLTSSSKIKRRPLKSNSKNVHKIADSRLSNTQVISIGSQMMKIENEVLDKQLNRLERTLNCSKAPHNPRYERQRCLLRRLNINKQNLQTQQPSKQVNFVVTSKFLQEIRDVNEQLYEISLNLYRFYEREKEQNDKISEQIKMRKKIIHQKSIILQDEKRKLGKIEAQIALQQKEQKNMELSLMRSWLKREYQ